MRYMRYVGLKNTLLPHLRQRQRSSIQLLYSCVPGMKKPKYTHTVHIHIQPASHAAVPFSRKNHCHTESPAIIQKDLLATDPFSIETPTEEVLR